MQTPVTHRPIRPTARVLPRTKPPRINLKKIVLRKVLTPDEYVRKRKRLGIHGRLNDKTFYTEMAHTFAFRDYER